jgi:hypothetical protein
MGRACAVTLAGAVSAVEEGIWLLEDAVGNECT